MPISADKFCPEENTTQFMKRIRSAGIIMNGEKVMLIHRLNQGKEYYVFPGGGVEKGESPEEAASREIGEETSLKAKIGKLLYHHVYDDDTEQFFYLCRYLSGEPKLGEANEAREMKENNASLYTPEWHEVKELPKLLLYPLEIRDWFMDDIKSDFKNTPREATLKTSELRESL